jgi:hypothetical protein
VSFTRHRYPQPVKQTGCRERLGTTGSPVVPKHAHKMVNSPRSELRRRYCHLQICSCQPLQATAASCQGTFLSTEMLALATSCNAFMSRLSRKRKQRFCAVRHRNQMPRSDVLIRRNADGSKPATNHVSVTTRLGRCKCAPTERSLSCDPIGASNPLPRIMWFRLQPGPAALTSHVHR